MKWILFVLLLFTSLFLSYGQQDTLPEVQVEANKINQPSSAYKVVHLSLDGTNSLSDVFKRNSAVYLKSYGVGNLSTISIRGANASQTQIIWNGFTINSPTLGQNDLSIASSSLIDNASLHLGASSTVNSSGGLGGAIQLENKSDFKKRLSLLASKELGSFGIDNTILKLKIGNDKWQSYTGFSKKHADNNFKYNDFLMKEPTVVRQSNAKYDQLELAQNIYYKPSVNHQIGLKTNFSTTQRLLPSIMGVKSKGEKQKDEAVKSSLEWSYNSGKYFQQIALGYFYDFLNYIDTTASINSVVKVNSLKGYYKGKYYFTDSSQLRLSLNTDKTRAISSGFDSQKYQVRDAIYLEYYQLLQNGLSYSVALRKEFITDVATPIIPSIALKWSKWKNHQFFISGAQNFRAPTFNDLYWSPGGNPNLVPENGLMVELGYLYQTRKHKLGITSYYSLINNWIQWLPSHKGYWQPQNIKEVESYGVEFSGERSVRVKDVEVQLNGSYNFILSQNKESSVVGDASVGKQLIYVPKNTALISIGVNYKRLLLAYSQSYNGSVFIDAANQSYMPYYAPANLRLDWSISKVDAKNLFSLGMAIDNLYDEEYQVVANRPLPGRFYRLILKVEFNK